MVRFGFLNLFKIVLVLFICMEAMVIVSKGNYLLMKDGVFG